MARDSFVDGNVSPFEIDVISRLIKFHQPKTLFEIGTFDGRTTLNMAAHSPPDARVYTLDLPASMVDKTALQLELNEELFINKEKSGGRFENVDIRHKIKQLYGDSATFDFSPYVNKVDFMFVDGSHSYDYVMQDTQTALSLVRQNGIILWHDYVSRGSTPFPGVTRALKQHYMSDGRFRSMKHLDGTSIVMLQVQDRNDPAVSRFQSELLNDSSQPGHLAASLKVAVPHTTVKAGTSIAIQVTARNIGHAVWLHSDAPTGPVRLGTKLYNPAGECINDSYWRNQLPDRQAIFPGETVAFDAELPAPPAGRYQIGFDLVADGVAWFNTAQAAKTAIEVLEEDRPVAKGEPSEPPPQRHRESRAASVLRNVALSIPRIRNLRDARDALLWERDQLGARLAEYQTAPPQPASSPFFHYNASFDPQEVIRRHAAADVKAVPEYVTNFLGVQIDPKFYPSFLPALAGQVEGIPIPANWHADIAEWGAALRAVDLAKGTFTVIELGCGWGCWINNTGVAARRAGLQVQLVGVEGDEGHLGFAREACATNSFASTQVTLHRGIAAATAGVALFPRQEQAGEKWGLKPVFGATEEQRRAAAQSGSHDELPMIPLDQIAAPHDRIDLLHIDIQGGEAAFIAGCLPIMRAKVAYVLVGTHSRQIEGHIMDTLLDDGWTLEIERPAILSLTDGGPQVTVDGVQGWLNPRLDSR